MEWGSGRGAPYYFPGNYIPLLILGRGGFGEVLKCIKVDSKETVAVKVPHGHFSSNKEVALLRFLMSNNLDKCNVVKFIDSFRLRDGRTALVFEMLDVSLRDYIIYQRDFTPLDLHDVRSVIQQMATALDALKTNEVIHSDIKLDNIMLVDRQEQPLRVKLIDFGMAFRTHSAKHGDTHQIRQYRAPEIFLGLPFSEAIDMWSLGVVMAYTMLGVGLFPGKTEYDALRYIVDLLGVPPDHLLNAGKYSTLYFVAKRGCWRLMTPAEYWAKAPRFGDYRSYQLCNLDDVERLPQKNLNMVTALEKTECIDLLKAMLQIDANERITPSQILVHPFITRGTLSVLSQEPGTRGPAEPGTRETAKSGTRGKVEPGTTQANETTESKAENCNSSLLWEEEKWWQYKTCSSGTSGFHSCDIMVKPAPPECCLELDEDIGQQSGACPVDCLEENPGGVDSPPTPLLPEGCNMEQEQTELCATPDDREPKTKKKKNIIIWMRKKFFSCICVDNDMD